MSRALMVCVLLATTSLVGCADRKGPLPTTYPVHGKVTYNGGLPVANALVQFHPKSEPRVSTSAVTGSDGAYSLLTKRDGLKVEGAVAGANRVTVFYTGHDGVSAQASGNVGAGPQAGGITSSQPAMFSTEFPTPYEVQPRDNEFNLTVERPRQ
jgi:hypothetical protein